MPTFSVDTSVMIAAVCSWHEHHSAAAREIEARLARKERLTVPAHALAEAYSVLTRLPSPYRLSPADSWSLLKANFVKHARIAALKNSAYVSLLARLAAANAGGGRTYDAVILKSSETAKADVLLTFNSKHFDTISSAIIVVEPR